MIRYRRVFSFVIVVAIAFGSATTLLSSRAAGASTQIPVTAPSPHTAAADLLGIHWPWDDDGPSLCSPSTTDYGFDSTKRCIQGINQKSRQKYMRSGCVTDGRALLPFAVYVKGECGNVRGGVEAIAQARLLAQMNVNYMFDGNAFGALHPDLQYEVRVPHKGTKRADIVAFDSRNDPKDIVHYNSFEPVEVYELKVVGTKEADETEKQLGEYVEGFNKGYADVGYNNVPAIPGRDVRNGHYQRYTNSYLYDYFQTLDPKNPDIVDTWKSYPDPYTDGIIWVEKTDSGQRPANIPPPQAPGDSGSSLWEQILNGIRGGLRGPKDVPAEPPVFVDLLAMTWNDPGRVYDRADLPLYMAASSWGDPHLVTFDGLQYDHQGAGEYTAFLTDTGAEMQLRFSPRGGDVSVVTAAAMQVGESTVQVDQSGRVFLNGTQVSMTPGHVFDLGGGGVIVRGVNGYEVIWPGSTIARPIVDLYPTGSQVTINAFMPKGTNISGMLGNGDGDPTNDLMLDDGTSLSMPVSRGLLYGGFADAWRVTDDTTLFAYDAGQSVSTLSDPTFPHSIVSLADYAPEDRDNAAQLCRTRGVNDAGLLEACALDYLKTHSLDFAAAAATVKPPVMVADGDFLASFESNTSEGVTPPRITSDPVSNRHLAGPFGNEAAHYTLSNLPPHTAVRVRADLAVLGDWDGETPSSGGERLTAAVDSTTLGSYGFSNTTAKQSYPVAGSPPRTGAAETNSLWTGQMQSSVYHFDWSVQHTASSVDFSVLGSNLAATTGGEQWALDNVEVTLSLVPPQTFSLPANGVVTSGAGGFGNLETVVSEDRYTFNAPAAGDYYLDMQSCAAPPWSVIDSTGKAVKSGSGCGDGRVTLPAGAYTLSVRSDGTFTGTYALQLFAVPSPQQFSLNPGVKIGPGGANGVANLETLASEDRYPFAMASDGNVLVDPATCGSNGRARWSIVNGSGVEVAHDDRCIDQRVALPAGAYALSWTPGSASSTGQYAFTLYQPPTDTSAPATFGQASVVSLVPGQRGTLSFTAAAGDHFAITTSGPLAACGVAISTLLTPNGQTAANLCSGFSEFTASQPGTHTINVAPVNTNSGSETVTVYKTIDATASATFGQPVNLSLGVGQNASVTIAGNAGDRIALTATGSLTSCVSASLWVKGPSGQYVSGLCSGFSELTLTQSGAYTVVVDPYNANTGNLTLTAYKPVDATAAVTFRQSVDLNLGVGQNASLTFVANAGDRINLTATGSLSICGQSYIKLLAPNGVSVNGGGCANNAVWMVTTSGTHTLVIDPYGANVGTLSATVVRTPPDIVQSETLGQPVTMNLGVDENGAVQFSASSGDRITVAATGPLASCAKVSAQLFAPNGAAIGSDACGGYSEVTLNATGTYTLRVDPSGTNSGSITVTAARVVDVVVSASSHQSQTVNVVPGQNIKIRFEGRAGDHWLLSSSGPLSDCSKVWMRVNNPDGSVLTEGLCPSLAWWDLTQTGTHTLSIDPWDSNAGSFTFTLVRTPLDIVRTATLGQPIEMSLGLDQNEAIQINAQAGDHLALSVNGAIANCSALSTSFIGPDGQSFGGGCNGFGEGTVQVSGLQTLRIDPNDTNTGSLTATVNKVNDFVAVSASRQTVSTTLVPGQNALFRFDANAGETVSFQATGTFADCSKAWTMVLEPSGAKTEGYCASAGWHQLTESGTHTISIDPFDANSGTLSLNIVISKPDVNATARVGSPFGVNLAPDENENVAFAANAGDRLSITWSGSLANCSHVWAAVLDASNHYVGGVCNRYNEVSIAQTGNYTLRIDPADGFSGFATVAINRLSDVTTTAVSDTPVTVSLTAGQNAFVKFGASKGNRVTFATTGDFADCSKAWTTVSDPNGKVILSGICPSFFWIDPTVTGTYTLSIDPFDDNEGNFTETIHIPSPPPPPKPPKPQTFGIKLGTAVSNGKPKKGAGNLETSLSEDVYTFSLKAATTVKVDMQACSPPGAPKWQVVNSKKKVMASGSGCTDATVTLPKGSYKLVFDSDGTFAGTYSFVVRSS